jgi:hypothetical protein
MKNLLILFVAFLPMISCDRPNANEEPSDKWNGYSKFLKTGEMVHTLWAGRHTNVGTVTYGLDDNANFYVTYDCSASGWKIAETNLFAGDKKNMPLNKPGHHKTLRFPYSKHHSPKVSTYTYRIPLTSLPPCEEPGFAVAAQCIVQSPGQLKCGYTETAWAEGDFKFTDKCFGWYDIYFYNQPSNQFPILYGTTYTYDTLRLYHIDVATGTADLILKEFVGNAPGTYDGAAYDVESGMFFFTNYNTGELWVNLLTGEDSSFSTGSLSGIAASGTFYNGAYYYVNENLNSINKVTFTNDWAIAGESALDTLPGLITVNDIAMSPAGDYLYIIGRYDGGGVELISWEVADHSSYTYSISVTDGAQIAYGSDGVLYAIAPTFEGGSNSTVYAIETDSGTLNEVNADAIIIIEDPFADLSTGPIL